jgi:hypothetical protein
MKTSVLSLSIATLAFGASTIYLAHRLHDELAHSERIAEESRALGARVAELEKARDEAGPVGVGSLGALNVTPGESASVAMPAPPPVKPDAGAQVAEAAVVNGPVMRLEGEAFRKMMRANMRAHNKQIYADVGSQLGLTREETSKLIDLLVDQQVAGIGFSPEVTDPAERNRLIQEAMRQNKAAIADLLGPAKLESLEEYQKSIPARQELDVLARQLDGSDASLSVDQRKRLLEALIEERKRIPLPIYSPGSSPEDHAKAYTDWQEDYNERIASQSRGILTSEQYAAYDEYQQWQKEMREQMASARGPNGVARGNFMFAPATPGVMVGESIAITTSSAETVKSP